MAAGLALLVPDLPDWIRMFVEPGFARGVDPVSADSIAAALEWFVNHSTQRQAMGARARTKIEVEWNYDTAFAPLLGAMSGV
jgi:hypothetical protein